MSVTHRPGLHDPTSEESRPFAFVADEAFVTKSGDIRMVLAVRAVDYECLDTKELDSVARSFQAAAWVFDEQHTPVLHVTAQ